MKTVTSLLLLALFINAFCDDDFLSKFHQNSFKIKDFRVELGNYSEKYFNYFQVKTYKFNRTTPAVNATFKLKIALKDKLEIQTQVYKFMSNEYRYFPINFQFNAKQYVDANVMGMGIMKSCGNVTMFFEKNVPYYLCNFVMDATHFPPLIPNGRFKVDVKKLYLQDDIALLYAFFEIYTPIPYPKN